MLPRDEAGISIDSGLIANFFYRSSREPHCLFLRGFSQLRTGRNTEQCAYAEGRVDKTEWAAFSADETFDTGMDSASPVSADYQSRFGFSGVMNKVEIDITPANLSQADQKKVEVAMLHAILNRQ